MTMRERVMCSRCDGTGEIENRPGEYYADCPDCDGTGWLDRYDEREYTSGPEAYDSEGDR